MSYDATLVGWCSGSDGLGRHFYAFAEALSDTLKINYALTCPNRAESFPPSVQRVLEEKEDVPGAVSIFTDILWLPNCDYLGYKKIPKESFIKIAYVTFESSRIPDEWVEILNTHFDLVAVPDIYCVRVFKQSGVNIPIFQLPLSVDLSPLLELPPKEKANYPFTFGNVSFISERKNQLLLVKAFAKAFGNRPDVRLKMNAKYSEPTALASLNLWLEEAKINNIELSFKRLNREVYVQFLDSLDCYVNVSKGEGFSIPPREALARGIPSIISNNSAQETLCATGYFKSIPATIEEPAWYETNLRYYGKCSTPTIEAVAEGLIDVYTHYPAYLEKAQQGKSWVSRYLPENLKPYYLNLVKPQKIILGDRNEITTEHLMTSSLNLYNKYQSYNFKANN